jgi:hypothetical protein
MACVLMKTGEWKDIPDEQIESFLAENKDLIQWRKVEVQRPRIKQEQNLAVNNQ